MTRFPFLHSYLRVLAIFGLFLAAATLHAQVGVPTLAQPSNNATEVATTATLLWRPVAGGVNYEVQLALDSAFSNLSYENSTTEYQHDVEGLWPDTLYYWRVRAVDSLDSVGAWSAPWSFRTVVTGAPRPVSPADGADDVPFDQAAVSFTYPTLPPSGFEVMYAFDPSFRNGVSIAAATKSAGLPTLPPDTTVYWRVRVVATAAPGAWSRVVSFTTTALPLPRLGLCTPLAPTNGIELEDLLISSFWSGPAGATAPTRFHVQFSQDQTMRSVAHDARDLDSTGLALTLSAPGDWYWRVRAVSTTEGVVDGPWSALASFKVVEPTTTALNAPVLLLPPNNSRWRGLTVTMSWDSVEGGESYEVEVGRDTAFDESDTVLSSTSHAARLAGLHPDTLYAWRVRALASEGKNRGPWSRPFTFSTRPGDTVLPGTPVQIAPAHEERDLNPTVEFHWNPASAASAHLVQVCADSLFAEGTQEFGAFDSTATGVLGEGGRWWWRVRGVNEFGPGPWSSARTFTTATVSAVPSRSDQRLRSISITPTPVVSSAQLVAQVAPLAEGRVTVASLKGDVVFESEFRADGEGTLRVDLPAKDLQSGVYRCRVATAAGEVLETPLVIAH